MIRSIKIKDFTAFHDLQLDCAPGLNVLLGRNATGKSHLLKLMYAVGAAAKGPDVMTEQEIDGSLTSKLKGVFKPEKNLGRLCRDEAKKCELHVTLSFDKAVTIAFSSDMDEIVITDNREYHTYSWMPVFIPPKEILSFFPGFSSLYLRRELTIDETYFDLCQALEAPILKEETTEPVQRILETIGDACDGEFLLVQQKRFYYKPRKGRMLEVELAAEGFRKLGMLQRLLQNGGIRPGVSGPLFWDEPEANLNPSLMKHLVEVLLELARAGQQVIIATHDYVVLKWIDLLAGPDDKVAYHALYRNEDGNVGVNSTDDYLKICPNAIDETFATLVDQDVQRSVGEIGK